MQDFKELFRKAQEKSRSANKLPATLFLFENVKLIPAPVVEQ